MEEDRIKFIVLHRYLISVSVCERRWERERAKERERERETEKERGGEGQKEKRAHIKYECIHRQIISKLDSLFILSDELNILLFLFNTPQ